MLYSLILVLIAGDPETGPAREWVMDYNLTAEDCTQALAENAPFFLGNNNVGFYCALQPAAVE